MWHWSSLNSGCILHVFFKKWAKSGLFFVYFCSFHMTNIVQIDHNDKSVNGVLGTRTRGGRVVGADEFTELWRHPILQFLFCKNCLKRTHKNEKEAGMANLKMSLHYLRMYFQISKAIYRVQNVFMTCYREHPLHREHLRMTTNMEK